MKLLTQVAKSELECLSRTISKLDAKDVGARWWTWARALAPGATNLTWCGAGEEFSEVESGPIEGRNNNKQCVVLKAKSGGGGGVSLTAAPCGEFNRPICRGSFAPRRTHIHDNCPKISCKVNMDQFPISSEVYYARDPPKNLFALSSFMDNRHYLVSSVQATWIEAQISCCSFGMTLMAINDPSKLTSAKKLNLDKAFAETNKDKPSKMFYWTAGYGSPDSNQFLWCHSGANLPNFKGWTEYNITTFKNSSQGGCVAMQFGPSREAADLILANCSEKNYYMCEKLLDENPGCTRATCPYFGYNEDLKLAVKSDLKQYENIKGKVLYSTCKRHLLITRDLFAFAAQPKVCSSFAMRPLEVETVQDWNCVHGAIQALEFATGVGYFLPVSDFNCPGKLTWCSSGRPFNVSFLNSTFIQENKTAVDFACVSLWKTPGLNLSSYRESCWLKTNTKKVICEIPE
ncbi:uncharacterized protein LOC132192815 [Neocloeon triangulifer]|uniref:uncharacterized protein LOC132192815 n=1 Tax=Neocloeon triangulifer TaxID=2078957 RepID=UPI00286F742E|nr:uncharacterized protein LOC132192815 [Neocloeon triangulifer]